MLNRSIKRLIFAEKGEAKSPVKLTGLGSLKKGNKKISFYNSKTGSKIGDITVAFKYEQPLLNKIIDIFSQQPSGSLI